MKFLYINKTKIGGGGGGGNGGFVACKSKLYIFFPFFFFVLLLSSFPIVIGQQQQQQQEEEEKEIINNDNEKGIKIIGAGLGRTGTYSVKTALERLGYKVYHYIDMKHSKYWYDYVEGKLTTNDIIDYIVNDGYNATIENPTCDIYSDIYDKFPSAKVVLTVRDNSEKFERSWKTLFNTMIVTEYPFTFYYPSFFQFISLFQHLKTIRCFMGTTHLNLKSCELTNKGWRNQKSTNSNSNGNSNNIDGWIAKQYERHNEHVMKTIPSDQLLVFNVKQGWDPLLKFLDIDKTNQTNYENIRKEPFPNSKGINDTSSLKMLRIYFLIVIYGWIPICLLLCFIFIRMIKKYFFKSDGNNNSTNTNNIGSNNTSNKKNQ